MRGTCFWEANGRRMTVSWWEEVQPPQRMEENTGGRAETSRALRQNNIRDDSLPQFGLIFGKTPNDHI